jgi:hypothetical protein
MYSNYIARIHMANNSQPSIPIPSILLGIIDIAAIEGLLAASSHWQRVFSSLKLRIGGSD